MDEYAKLLTSVAALFGAVAWPASFLIVVFLFRSELKSALIKVPIMLDRVKKALQMQRPKTKPTRAER